MLFDVTHIACASILPGDLVAVASRNGLTFVRPVRLLDGDLVLVHAAAQAEQVERQFFTCLLTEAQIRGQALIYDRFLANLALADVREVLAEHKESRSGWERLRPGSTGLQNSTGLQASTVSCGERKASAPQADKHPPSSTVPLVARTVMVLPTDFIHAAVASEPLFAQLRQRQQHPSARQFQLFLLRAAARASAEWAVTDPTLRWQARALHEALLWYRRGRVSLEVTPLYARGAHTGITGCQLAVDVLLRSAA